MRKILFFLAAILFFFQANRANAQTSWTINNFDSNIKIQNDGKIAVSEKIDVDFGGVEKHGIYRDLPYVYTGNDGNIYTKIDNIHVTQDGTEATTQITQNDNNLEIRIGDPNNTINGKHDYLITYTVAGVLKSFPDHDELYWNVTGNGWEAPILQANAEVTAQNGGIIKIACYEGFTNSTDPCRDSTVSSGVADFSATKTLDNLEGLTIVVGLQKGIYPILNIAKPQTFLEKFFSFPSISLFSIILAAGFLGIFFTWWKLGRDFWTPGISGYNEKNKTGEEKPIGAYEPTVVEFTPPLNLPPALIGVIADERADTLDVTSTIIDLAGKGYLTITEIPKKWMFGSVDYSLKKTQKDKSNLLSYEKLLLDKIFTVDEIKVSDLKRDFYEDLAQVKEKIYEEAVKQKFFPENPETIRNKYLLIGILLFIVGIIASIFSLSNEFVFLADIGMALVISSIIIIIFSRFMPRRTAYGREIYRRIKGYRLFISTSEKYRQRFFENNNMFNEILPYAIVFGLTEKFAKALADMGIKPKNPTWYHSATAFNAIAFSNNISNFSSSLSSAIAAGPTSSGFSSGGGFSGGGFGGGGGGSW